MPRRRFCPYCGARLVRGHSCSGRRRKKPASKTRVKIRYKTVIRRKTVFDRHVPATVMVRSLRAAAGNSRRQGRDAEADALLAVARRIAAKGSYGRQPR